MDALMARFRLRTPDVLLQNVRGGIWDIIADCDDLKNMILSQMMIVNKTGQGGMRACQFWKSLAAEVCLLYVCLPSTIAMPDELRCGNGRTFSETSAMFVSSDTTFSKLCICSAEQSMSSHRVHTCGRRSINISRLSCGHLPPNPLNQNLMSQRTSVTTWRGSTHWQVHFELHRS